MNLLEQLHEEMKALPKLLRDESIWQDLLVTYEPPMVERLWTQRGDNRLFLHRIHPCDNDSALLHPHAWPSAVHIVDGTYRMDVAYSYEDQYGYQVGPALTTYFTKGSSYLMDQHETYHSVCPIDKPSLSVMLTGPKWKDSRYQFMVDTGRLAFPKEKQPNLTAEQRSKLFADFRWNFPLPYSD